jgi:Contractile injection system tube protein
MPREALSRARIDALNRDGLPLGVSIVFDLNPESLNLTVQHATQTKKRRTRQRVQYTGDSTVSLKFDAYFDSTRPRDQGVTSRHGDKQKEASYGEELDVRERTRIFVELIDKEEKQKKKKKSKTEGDKKTSDGKEGTKAKTRTIKTHYAPLIRLVWGSFLFEGVISSYSETLEYWSPEGVPLRAKVSVTLQQVTHKLQITADKVRLEQQRASHMGEVGESLEATRATESAALPSEDGDPGGISTADRPEPALDAFDLPLDRANDLAAQNGLDRLDDLASASSLSFDAGLSVGIDVAAEVSLSLGLETSVSLEVGASVSLPDVLANEVYDSGRPSSGSTGNPWAPDGPAPGTRAAEIAAEINRQPLPGPPSSPLPQSAELIASVPASTPPSRPAPLRGSPPRWAPRTVQPDDQAVFRLQRRTMTSWQPGRPRWEGAADDSGAPDVGAPDDRCCPPRRKPW